MWFDLHVHTKWSKDSLNEPVKLLKKAKRAGLDGFAVTDHNEIEGALFTYKEAKRYDVKVLVGEEVMTDSGEVIALNITELVPPHRPVEETIDLIKEQGGLVLAPHPFDTRRKGLGPILLKVADKVDLIEVVNGRSFHSDNEKALRFAEKLKKPMVGGSDAHTLIELGKVATFIEGGDLRRPIKIRRRWWPPLALGILGSNYARVRKRLVKGHVLLQDWDHVV